MLGKEIKRLERLRAQYQERLDTVYDFPVDPNVMANFQSDMQYEILKIEEAILHERYMMPFRYLLAVFVVAVLGLIIYSI